MSAILAEWTTFAAKAAPPDAGMSPLALTDHAQGILNAIAGDIDTYQSQQQQFAKSQGDEDELASTESAAAIHGRLRHASSFSLLQLSSEFRALRATVLRLWLPQVAHMSATTIEEMVRFNEAIDQALAESIVTYSARAERTRDLFLAVLGHDLRAPLANLALAGELLTRQAIAPAQVHALGLKTRRSAALMNAMVTDLLGYTRLQLGAGMPVTRTRVDLHDVCVASVDDARAMYPGSAIIYHGGRDADLSGEFDAVRLQQLVTNLLINAAQYSTPGRDITLAAAADATAITLSVTNFGPVIPAAELGTIFLPLVQLDPDTDDEAKPRTSLGLGLFIAQETAAAHQGTIVVTSGAAAGTVFTVRLPRA